MKTSEAGLALIKKYEGLRLDAYRCPAGVLTIGYGHSSAAGGPIVYVGMKISQQMAEDILKRDLEKFEAGVLSSINSVPTQSQLDAMVSLAFNIGIRAFSTSSVVRYYNAGDMEKAAGAFALWKKAGGKVLPGLVRRRAEEAALFRASITKPKDEAVEEKPPAPDVEATENWIVKILKALGIVK